MIHKSRIIFIILGITLVEVCSQTIDPCPVQDLILPCRCSQRAEEIQIWCSHSDLPRVLNGIKSVSNAIIKPIDELILESNLLPSLPGRSFSTLKILRLMLRHNKLERLSSGWLNDLDDSLVEIFIVEKDLRSVPIDSLNGLKKLEAITIQSETLKHLPDFSGLQKLRYINIQSPGLIELIPIGFRGLINLETVYINGSPELGRLEAGLFHDLQKLNYLNVADNGINWMHLRALVGLPNLKSFILSGNKITDAGMVGRAIKDIINLEILKLDHNEINILGEGSFVDLRMLKEIYLNNNRITEIHHGAFHRVPNLKKVHLENNFLRRIHPESFLQASGSGVEILHMHHNDVGRIEELRSLLDALPTLKFLDFSFNKLEEIPFGALRGHGTLEQLYLDHNMIRMIERDAFMAMPGLRELRLKNNSISDLLTAPFWNLPGLKGLDLSYNKIRRLDQSILMGLPSLRQIDISGNSMNVIEPATFAQNGMLETINISKNEIVQIHPATFRNLDGLFEVDASYNLLPEIILGLPRAVERVILKNNNIRNLAPSKALDLPNLRLLDISDNGIERIPRSVFQTLSKLKVLNMAKNKVESIEENVLAGLNNLEMINFQDNQIITIHERSLNHLNELKELNIQGNRLELLGDRLLENLHKLERLDVSRNNIMEIYPNTLRNMRSLQVIDLSSNNLKQLPESLTGLTELKDIDVSFNAISQLTPGIIATLRNLEELKASNNKVNNLRNGLFRSLPLLQYLDLSSNEIVLLEQGAIKNLPVLQELVLADNKLIDIPDRVFEDLPNLQVVHLQQNYLRSISPDGFFHSPAIVYLNLSSNQFRFMDHVGLKSVRNLEVLDLSNNEIRKITSGPLRGLDWLVELKLDDNRICKIQGEPFSSMPRLRVLSMRNNRMVSLPEMSFRTLRGNIAILDLDGNPLDCSCDMLWLRAWLEAESNNPGPRCRDGTMLRESRITRIDCQYDGRNNQFPLTNDHGDLFLREANLHECENENLEELQNPLPPPEESEYFYDQFVDYPINETHLAITNQTSILPISTTLPKLPTNTQFNPNNTLLNFNKFNLHNPRPPQSTSPFTFFGVPLPAISLGNLWGGGTHTNIGRDIRNRGAGIPNSRGKGRLQTYRPDDQEILKFVQQFGRYPDAEHRTQIGSIVEDTETFNEQPERNLYNRNYFQTPFRKPEVEQGGFYPILPGNGGFKPIIGVYNNSKSNNEDNFQNQNNNSDIGYKTDWPDEFPELVPLITEPSGGQNVLHVAETTQPNTTPLTPYTAQTTQISIYHTEDKFPEYTNRFDYITRPSIFSLISSSTTSTTSTPVTESSVTTTFSSLPNKFNNYITTINPVVKNYYNHDEDKLEEIKSSEEIVTHTSFESSKLQPYQYSTTNSPLFTFSRQPPDSWENINNSVSPLVAPGAQQNTFRSGRPTITKIIPTLPPDLPTAEEYLRGSSHYKNSYKFNEHDGLQQSDEITTITIERLEPKKTEDMKWYFANYNKTNYIKYETNINNDKSFGPRNNLISKYICIMAFLMFFIC